MTYQLRATCLLSLICALNLSNPLDADWLQFRGTEGTSSIATRLPTKFGGDEQTNVAWKTPLPGRAVNAPIVVGDQVLTTASSGNQQKRLHIFSVDDSTGEIQWERRFWATGRTLCHPLSAVAAPTPASDGQLVYALFASNDLICVDLNGNVQWMRALSLEFPSAFDDRGLASSPTCVDGMLVVQIASSGDSFALGIDATTGKTRWSLPLAKSTNWASPSPIAFEDDRLVMLQSAKRLLLLEPASGDIKQEYEAEGNLIPSPAFVDGTVLLPANGMTALALRPEASEPEVLWREAKVGAETASPVIKDEWFFVIRQPNILTAARIDDGTVLWKQRLTGNSFWATPLIDDSNVYVANSDGLVQVVSLVDGEVIAANDLGEEILGSPAASTNALYFRTATSLFKIKAL